MRKIFEWDVLRIKSTMKSEVGSQKSEKQILTSDLRLLTSDLFY